MLRRLEYDSQRTVEQLPIHELVYGPAAVLFNLVILRTYLGRTAEDDDEIFRIFLDDVPPLPAKPFSEDLHSREEDTVKMELSSSGEDEKPDPRLSRRALSDLSSC